MTLRVALGGSEARVRVTYIWHPFREMLDWLLAILEGRDATLAVNEEGCFAYLDATSGAYADAVRLRIRMFVPEAVVVDHEVDRLALVRAFREAVRAVWDKPDRATFWSEWFWYGYPEWQEDHPDWPGPGVDWARLDAALAARR